MLKNLGYDGAYHDQNLSVSVLLENPLDFGLEPVTLVFSVTVKGKQDCAVNLNIEDFTFYIMDEQNRIYNMQKATGLQPNIETADRDDEPIRKPDALIFADFNPIFLFENLRIAFYYAPDRKFYITELKH